MQGPPADHLGPYPGPVLGEILNFLELSSLLFKMGKVTVPTPVPTPRGGSWTRLLGFKSWSQHLPAVFP